MKNDWLSIGGGVLVDVYSRARDMITKLRYAPFDIRRKPISQRPFFFFFFFFDGFFFFFFFFS
jgi:hypothetical protein